MKIEGLTIINKLRDTYAKELQDCENLFETTRKEQESLPIWQRSLTIFNSIYRDIDAYSDKIDALDELTKLFSEDKMKNYHCKKDS